MAGKAGRGSESRGEAGIVVEYSGEAGKARRGLERRVE